MDRAELEGREGRQCAEVPRTGPCRSSCFTCSRRGCLGKWAQGSGGEGACSSETHLDSSCLKPSHLGPRGPLRTPQGFFRASKSLPWCQPYFLPPPSCVLLMSTENHLCQTKLTYQMVSSASLLRSFPWSSDSEEEGVVFVISTCVMWYGRAAWPGAPQLSLARTDGAHHRALGSGLPAAPGTLQCSVST